jgi:acetyl-CoA carboxylase biotin carboxylase subunit
VRTGYRVPPNYDSMVGKLIVHAPTREACIRRSLGALSEFKIGPIRSTIPLYMRLLQEQPFVDATHDIKWVERLLAPPARCTLAARSIGTGVPCAAVRR